MLKLKFLGINGSVQEEDSGNTSLMVCSGENAVAVDLSCNLDKVVAACPDAVFLTHEHIDHVYGLPSLLHQMWLVGREKPLRIYCPKGLEALINSMIDLFGIRQKKNIFPITVSNDAEFDVGNIHCTQFSTDHSKFSAGIVFQDTCDMDRIVYTADTRPMLERLKSSPEEMKIFCGARILVHEASGVHLNEETLVKKGHSSGKDAAELAEFLGAAQLFLCHLPRGKEAKQPVLEEARAIFPGTSIPNIL